MVIGLVLLVAQERDTLRVDVRLTQVVVTVTDASGHFVTNLRPEDFTVEFDGIPQRIAHFTQDIDTPVSLGILIDVSRSMYPRLSAARLAGSRFIHGMRDADEFVLMTFATRMHVEHDLTQDRIKLDKALEEVDGGPGIGVFGVGMGTNLYPAVNKAVDKIRNGKHRKRALIVISDGGNNSTDAFQKFRTDLRSAEIMMYSVHIKEAYELQPGIRAPGSGYRELVMKTIADETGGRWFSVNGGATSTTLTKQFDDVFAQISAELRGQYSIGFYPPEHSRNLGKTRVQTNNSAYKVRFR